MSLNDTPRSTRVHIALFGRRNAGKSSIINAITGQYSAIVSEIKGTTTDPVYKSIEILPIGPCVIIDTAGTDDLGELGELRIKKTMEVIDKADIAVLAVDATEGITDNDREVLQKIKSKNIPVLLVVNKVDILTMSKDAIEALKNELHIPVVSVSALKGQGIDELKREIIALINQKEDNIKLIGDILEPGDLVVLITPIDEAAPKGRLILPQVQTIRDVLDSCGVAIVTKENKLKELLGTFGKKPKLVVTDSQVFSKVAGEIPEDIPLTSFSILFARFKGELAELVKGAKAVEELKDGDKVLISEGCTHHRQSDDIGTVKLPGWIRQYTGKNIDFEYSSGQEFTEDVRKYALIIHCGGCMLNRASMTNRIKSAVSFNTPIVNYGVLIAYMQGILKRVLYPFPESRHLLEE